MHPDLDRVRAQPLFASLSDGDLARVAAWLEVRSASTGERLTPEGRSGYTFFLIEEGTASVIHEGEHLRGLGPGDFFGELAILGDGRRSADVVADSPMSLLALFGTHFREMEAVLPDVAASIRKAMEERLRG
jgi:CRP-like cAMP-binding protein